MPVPRHTILQAHDVVAHHDQIRLIHVFYQQLLGRPGRAMHEALAAHYNDGSQFALHYVTAREMFNVARAAMDGHRGNPNDYRDYVLPPPPIAS